MKWLRLVKGRLYRRIMCEESMTWPLAVEPLSGPHWPLARPAVVTSQLAHRHSPGAKLKVSGLEALLPSRAATLSGML